MRLKIIFLTIFALLGILALNLFHAQVIRGPYYFDLSVNNRIRVVPIEGRRGRIMDRNGKVLADNRRVYHVTVIPQDIQDKDELFEFLSQRLRVDKKTLLQRFFQKRATPFAPVILAADVDKQVAMNLEEDRFRFPGLYIQESVQRWYPFAETGSHVLGYVGKINRSQIERLKDYGYSPLSIVGKTGVEEYYDRYLRGKRGGQQIEVNSRGQQERLLSIREPESGRDIQLTIDQRVQEVSGEVLGNHRGTIVVMDMDSGEVLGMISSPYFDPNIFVDHRLQKKAGFVFSNPASPLLNRAITGLYPPGSVFKTVISAAGVDTGKITPHTPFICHGFYKPAHRRFRCVHVHGQLDLVGALLRSCNVYFYHVGERLGSDLIHKYARLFHLGELTRIDLPFEKKGYVPNRRLRKLQGKKWYDGDTLNFSIGQGDLLVTPLQMVRLMSTIGRLGQVPQPHLIKAVGSREVVPASTVGDVRIPDEVLDVVRRGIRQAVAHPEGTARTLDLRNWEVSGKTGTAQAGADKKDHAWFVGYQRAGKKQIAFCVFLEHGGSSYNAVLLARQLLRRMEEEELL